MAAPRCLSTRFLRLIEAGIIRREVFDDAVLQQLLNSGRIQDDCVSADMLLALLEAGRIRSPLAQEDVTFLKRFGILRHEVQLHAQQLSFEEPPLRYRSGRASQF
jgi:hypothetical protein